MNDMQLVIPGRIDLVMIDHIETTMQREYEEVLALGEEARDLSRTAAALEQRVAEERVDPETALWMFVRLRAFLDELREEQEAEAALIVESARRDVERIRRGGSPLALSFAGALRTRAAHAAIPTCVPDEIRWWPTPVAPPLPVVTPALAPVVAERVLAESVATLAPVDLAPFAQLGMLDIDAAGDGNTVVADSVGDPEFWSADSPQRWWRRPRVATASVTLQIAAGVAVAAAVAIHFS